MPNQTEMILLDELTRVIDGRPGTRGDFAKAVGIGQAYLSQILSGKRPMERLPLGTVRKISEISGIPLDRLASAPLAPECEEPAQ